MDPAGLAVFAASRVFYGLLPGPNNAVVLARTLGGDPVGAVAFSTGLLLGNLCLMSAVSVGLNVWMQAHPGFVVAINWACAAYLVWLATGMLRDADRVARHGPADPLQPCKVVARGALPVATGIVASFFNPQLLVFYVAVLPDVLDLQAVSLQMLGQVGLVNILAMIVVFGGVVCLGVQVRRVVGTPAHLSALRRAGAAVMLLAAVWIAAA